MEINGKNSSGEVFFSLFDYNGMTQTHTHTHCRENHMACNNVIVWYFVFPSNSSKEEKKNEKSNDSAFETHVFHFYEIKMISMALGELLT